MALIESAEGVQDNDGSYDSGGCESQALEYSAVDIGLGDHVPFHGFEARIDFLEPLHDLVELFLCHLLLTHGDDPFNIGEEPPKIKSFRPRAVAGIWTRRVRDAAGACKGRGPARRP